MTERERETECTKIARFSAVAAAIFTAPPQNRAIFEAPRGAICSAKKIASERRFSLRLQGTNLIPTAEFPAIPESAAKIARERRCAILVHSGEREREPKTHIFAENRTFSQIHPFFWKFKHLEGADLDFRRKPQETADWALGASPLARF